MADTPNIVRQPLATADSNSNFFRIVLATDSNLNTKFNFPASYHKPN